MKVAIQGYEGSFHHMAAQYYYGREVDIVPCATFKALAQLVHTGQAGAGVMAIENSIAGSILSNYNLLDQYELSIEGEIFLQIRQHLLASQGTTITDIREVHSHTMALQQCYSYLDQYSFKLVETDDTALSAKHISMHKSKHQAAIASSLAAEMYGLQILQADIHSEPNNFTRFLCVSKNLQTQIQPSKKCSLRFVAAHTTGSLAKVLQIIANHGCNLSKIQSLPIPTSPFRYAFHADVEYETHQQVNNVITALKAETEALKIYGMYKPGIWKTS